MHNNSLHKVRGKNGYAFRDASQNNWLQVFPMDQSSMTNHKA